MKVQRRVRINPESTLLHVIGICGVRPYDEDELLEQGFSLIRLHAEGNIATFIYEKEEDDESK